MTQMIQQTTGGTIRSVHRAKESPGLGEELAHGRRLEFGEEGTTVDGSKVGDVAEEVEFVGDDRVSAGLLQVETGVGDEIAGGQEVLHLFANVRWGASDQFGEVCCVPREIDLARCTTKIDGGGSLQGSQPIVKFFLEIVQVEVSWEEDLLMHR